jgi:hypothetical protein
VLITTEIYEFLREMKRGRTEVLAGVFRGLRSVEVDFDGFRECSGAWGEELEDDLRKTKESWWSGSRR